MTIYQNILKVLVIIFIMFSQIRSFSLTKYVKINVKSINRIEFRALTTQTACQSDLSLFKQKFKCEKEEDIEQLGNVVANCIQPGDVLLLKGYEYMQYIL